MRRKCEYKKTTSAAMECSSHVDPTISLSPIVGEWYEEHAMFVLGFQAGGSRGRTSRWRFVRAKASSPPPPLVTRVNEGQGAQGVCSPSQLFERRKDGLSELRM